MANDTRQLEYTELTAACGETVYVRLETNPVKAAEMIVAFMNENCARRACPMTQPRQSTRNILWSDLLAILDKKERSIMICLRNGRTQLEISSLLGYANHSAVCKALARIRGKAKRLLG